MMDMEKKTLFCCFGPDLLAGFYPGAMIVKGVFAVLFGLMFMLSPDLFPWTLGVLLVINGAFALGAAFSLKDGRWFVVSYSLLAALLGIVIMARPLAWEFLAIWVLGIWLVVSGVVQVIRLVWNRDNDVSILMRLISALFSAFLGVLFFLHPFLGAIAVNAFAGASLLCLGVFFVVFGIVLKVRAPKDAAVGQGVEK